MNFERDQHQTLVLKPKRCQGTEDGRVRNGTDLMREKAHSESYLQKESVELKQENTMFGYGILGTLLVICLVVWIIKRT
jgi:hypothetical protein